MTTEAKGLVRQLFEVAGLLPAGFAAGFTVYAVRHPSSSVVALSAKPSVIVITGRPASGKSTLSQKLADSLGYLLLSRDAEKEALLRELGLSHKQAGQDINQRATRRVFAQADDMLAQGVNVIVDAAFQQKT